MVKVGMQGRVINFNQKRKNVNAQNPESPTLRKTVVKMRYNDGEEFFFKNGE